MKLKYPAEAFALGIVLFSAGMKEAFAAGILVILAVVFAEFLKNLLESLVPEWSLKASVLIGTASLSAGAFLLGFTALGIPVKTEVWIMTFILGLLAARYVLTVDAEAEYGEIFWESGILWGFWVLLAIAREFMTNGAVFGNILLKADFQSKSFAGMYFGFIVAGLALAFTNGILKKKNSDTQSLFVIVPLVAFARPFMMTGFGEIIGSLWTALVPIALFLSVKKVLKFARTGQACRGLPTEMMAMGFIYMILSIY